MQALDQIASAMNKAGFQIAEESVHPTDDQIVTEDRDTLHFAVQDDNTITWETGGLSVPVGKVSTRVSGADPEWDAMVEVFKELHPLESYPKVKAWIGRRLYDPEGCAAQLAELWKKHHPCEPMIHGFDIQGQFDALMELTHHMSAMDEPMVKMLAKDESKVATIMAETIRGVLTDPSQEIDPMKAVDDMLDDFLDITMALKKLTTQRRW